MSYFIETPGTAFIKTSVATASRGFCDILAIHVGIVHKSSSQKPTANSMRTVVIASISAMPQCTGGQARSMLLASSRVTAGGDLLALGIGFDRKRVVLHTH